MVLGGLGLRLQDIGERLVVLLDLGPPGLVRETLLERGHFPEFWRRLLEDFIHPASRGFHPDKCLHGRFSCAEQL